MHTGTWGAAPALAAAVLVAACSAFPPLVPGRAAPGADIWEAVRATCGTRPKQPAPRIHGFSSHELPRALGFHKPRTDEVWIRHPWVGPGTWDVTQACVLAHEMAHYAGVTGEADATACARAALARLSGVPVAAVRCGRGTASRPRAGMGSSVKAWFPVPSWLNAAGVEVIRMMGQRVKALRKYLSEHAKTDLSTRGRRSGDTAPARRSRRGFEAIADERGIDAPSHASGGSRGRARVDLWHQLGSGSRRPRERTDHLATPLLRRAHSTRATLRANVLYPWRTDAKVT